jgi:hypothetical protein
MNLTAKDRMFLIGMNAITACVMSFGWWLALDFVIAEKLLLAEQRGYTRGWNDAGIVLRDESMTWIKTK